MPLYIDWLKKFHALFDSMICQSSIPDGMVNKLSRKHGFFASLSFILPLLLLCLTTAGTAPAMATTRASAASTVMLVVGDSLSAAYGIKREQGWVHLLAQQLKKSDNDSLIANISISGETTAGGLQRLPAALDKWQPDIVILELGANDGLRGKSLKLAQQNLTKMIELSQQHDAKVLLLGMHIPPNYGPRYSKAFHQIYWDLADQYQLALLPFLLEGIATTPELMQDDGLHPTSEAQPLMRDLVYQQLKPLLND